MSQQRRGRIDALADPSAGSSPVSPTLICGLPAGKTQGGPNERAIPEGVLRDSAEVSRFWSYVDKTGDCWLWTGGKRGKGYGAFNVRKDAKGFRMVNAHRYAYEVSVGPIPEGLVIDHLCGKRLCVNPAHLEATTNRENITRDPGRRPKLTERQADYLAELARFRFLHPDHFAPARYKAAYSTLQSLVGRGFAERVPGAYAALFRVTAEGLAVLDVPNEAEAV